MNLFFFFFVHECGLLSIFATATVTYITLYRSLCGRSCVHSIEENCNKGTESKTSARHTIFSTQREQQIFHRSFSHLEKHKCKSVAVQFNFKWMKDLKMNKLFSFMFSSDSEFESNFNSPFVCYSKDCLHHMPFSRTSLQFNSIIRKIPFSFRLLEAIKNTSAMFSG